MEPDALSSGLVLGFRLLQIGGTTLRISHSRGSERLSAQALKGFMKFPKGKARQFRGAGSHAIGVERRTRNIPENQMIIKDDMPKG